MRLLNVRCADLARFAMAGVLIFLGASYRGRAGSA